MNPPTATRDPAALLEAYLEGDAGAFRELFEREAPVVQRSLRRAGVPTSELPDLVQRTFLQLHRARRDYRRGDPVRPWIMTIAANLRRDLMRRRGRWRETDRVEEKTNGATPQGLLEARQGERSVRQALSTLPADQRQVIELHWFEELGFAEIASLLEISESAAKVRAHRGYERLRELLRKGRGDDHA